MIDFTIMARWKRNGCLSFTKKDKYPCKTSRKSLRQGSLAILSSSPLCDMTKRRDIFNLVKSYIFLILCKPAAAAASTTIGSIAPRIVEPRVKDYSFMKHHISGAKGVPRSLTYLLDEQNDPQSKLFMACRRIVNVHDAAPHVDLHTHSVTQTYCWIGDNNDLRGLTVELITDETTILLDSPKTVVIPAGVRHAHRYISGSGIFIGIVETNGKSYNEVTN